MDTNAPKTPVTLPFAAWQALGPAAAAREVRARVMALPPGLWRAAVALLRPESELAEALEVGASLLATSSSTVASKLAPTGQPLRPLHGVPYLLKDLFDLASVPTRAGSTFLEKVRPLPARDCALAARLSELGAAWAGKTHLVEFAAGLFGDNGHYGDCPHPHDPGRLAGGSSSGSAALVAAGVVPLAVGTDTGGSVRVPAAFCGVYGFRLSPDEAFVRDAFPLSPTMDTAGWFTGNAADMLATIRALVGVNAPTKTPRGCMLSAHDLGLTGDPEVAAACGRAAAPLAPPADRATADALRSAWQGSVEAYSTIALSEAHAIHRDWLAPYHEAYEPGIWQRFTAGGRYPEAQLAAARATLARVREGWRQLFSAYDFLILPCVPFAALRKAECTPEARAQILTLTTPASLGGVPVLTLPVALPSGLTAGLQIIVPSADSAVVSWVLGLL